MKYRNINQKAYCCVPASISMILERRGIKPPSQEDIAYDLGVVLPPEHKHLLPKSYNVPKPKTGYGTRIHLKPYSLTSFFKKRKYKLVERFVLANRFKTSEQLRLFLQKNLDEKNDQMICFNIGLLKRQKRSYGHCAVVARVGKKMVFMSNPSPKQKKLRRIYIADLLKAMKKHYKGGIWVISSK